MALPTSASGMVAANVSDIFGFNAGKLDEVGSQKNHMS
jgi:hypothetical protein